MDDGLGSEEYSVLFDAKKRLACIIALIGLYKDVHFPKPSIFNNPPPCRQVC